MTTEQVIVVNKNDEIIGYKDREDLKRSDVNRVSALWLTNFKGKILLSQRAYSKKYDSGFWGPAAAGTVTKGETYLDNFIKEVREEIGLENFEFTKNKKTFIAGKFNFFCQWYLAKVDRKIEEFKIDKREVESVRWFTKQELLKELKENPEKFLPVIKNCLKWFEK